MMTNAYLLAKIGADTAENEQHFAEILLIGRRVADRCSAAARASRTTSSARSRRGPRAVRRGVRPGRESSVKLKWKITCSCKWNLNVLQSEN